RLNFAENVNVYWKYLLSLTIKIFVRENDLSEAVNYHTDSLMLIDIYVFVKRLHKLLMKQCRALLSLLSYHTWPLYQKAPLLQRAGTLHLHAGIQLIVEWLGVSLDFFPLRMEQSASGRNFVYRIGLHCSDQFWPVNGAVHNNFQSLVVLQRVGGE